MTMLAILALAATATLEPIRHAPGKPLSWEAELSDEEALAFEEGNEWVAEMVERKRLWDNFLALVNCRESPQSTQGVRFLISYKGGVWGFDEYGHFWCDSRFVRDDEQEALEVLESWFRELVERSPYAGFPWAEEKGETMTFRGFEDGRFNVLDFQLMRICEEFNAAPESLWPEGAPRGIGSVHELHPRLLKSLLLEDNYWDYPGELNEDAINLAIRELTECGLNEGGRFEGWFNALQDYSATHKWQGDNEYFHAQFADRVTRRFNNPGLYVPVISRKEANGQD